MDRTARTQNMEKAAFPRPDFIRRNWMTLDGQWEFAFSHQLNRPFPEGYNADPLPDNITVPFCYQSQASGIGSSQYCEKVCYRRTFTLTEEQLSGEVLLKIGAADYSCKIWVNNILAGSHTGGHTQFELSIASYLQPGQNQVALMIEDNLDCDRPRGKQYWKQTPDRCWYTPVTGIWKSVWLEFTSKTYIRYVKLTPDIDRRCLELELYLNQNASGRLQVQINYHGQRKRELLYSFQNSHYLKEVIALQEEDFVDEIHYWTPDSPCIYDLTLQLEAPETDRVECYFGMRKIEVKNGRVFLNHRVLYQKLVLDQGYWEESLLTPPSPEALKQDIELTKEMGFNGARKHQKLEDPRYYYYADVLGLLVWCEMPSGYQFDDQEIGYMVQEWQEVLREVYNHPSVIAWVPLNESWGIRNVLNDPRQQAFTSSLYYLTKAYDPMRLISSNDGWELPDHTDLFCIHDYEGDPETLYRRYEDFNGFLQTGIPNRQALIHKASYHGQPFLLTEYGGIALAGNSGEHIWGYHKFAASKEEYRDRIARLTSAIELLPDCCGYCYTQLTDVMQEANGLLTSERHPKVPLSSLAAIFKGSTALDDLAHTSK